MSYAGGDLKVRLREEDAEWAASTDARHEYGYEDAGRPRPPFVYLPHSCEEWIIGGPDEIKAMIADLQSALKMMTTRPEKNAP